MFQHKSSAQRHTIIHFSTTQRQVLSAVESHPYCIDMWSSLADTKSYRYDIFWEQLQTQVTRAFIYPALKDRASLEFHLNCKDML